MPDPNQNPIPPIGKLTIDEFRSRIDSTMVKCEMCDFTAHSIVRHARTEHKLSVAQYRNKFPQARFYSPILAEVVRRMDRKTQTSDDFEHHLKHFPLQGDPRSVFAKWKSLFTFPANLAEYIPTQLPHFAFEEQDKKIAWALARGKNVYIEGPTGCGKTESVFQICNALGIPVRRVNMNGDVTVKNFVGTKEAGPSGTYFKEGILPWCMENGVPLLVDEFDFTPPHIASILHPVLENGRRTYIPDAGREYVAKSGFTVIVTANTGGKGDATGVYTGTEILNTACLDRFPVKMSKGYLTPAQETTLLTSLYPTESLINVQKMVQLAGLIRDAFLQGKLSLTLSTRKLIDYFEQKRDFSAEEALDMTLISWLDGDDVSFVDGLVKRIEIGGKKTK